MLQIISNSFILMMVLNEASERLNSIQISEVIVERSQRKIYKNPATLKDSLEYRLKLDGYVKGVTQANRILYSITPKGKTLLN
jgi:hypothetical protein